MRTIYDSDSSQSDSEEDDVVPNANKSTLEQLALPPPPSHWTETLPHDTHYDAPIQDVQSPEQSDDATAKAGRKPLPIQNEHVVVPRTDPADPLAVLLDSFNSGLGATASVLKRNGVPDVAALDSMRPEYWATFASTSVRCLAVRYRSHY